VVHQLAEGEKVGVDDSKREADQRRRQMTRLVVAGLELEMDLLVADLGRRVTSAKSRSSGGRRPSCQLVDMMSERKVE
jgi:hypothetical protein